MEEQNVRNEHKEDIWHACSTIELVFHNILVMIVSAKAFHVDKDSLHLKMENSILKKMLALR